MYTRPVPCDNPISNRILAADGAARLLKMTRHCAKLDGWTVDLSGTYVAEVRPGNGLVWDQAAVARFRM